MGHYDLAYGLLTGSRDPATKSCLGHTPLLFPVLELDFGTSRNAGRKGPLMWQDSQETSQQRGHAMFYHSS